MSSSTDPVRVARLGRPHGLDGFLGLYVDEPELVHFQVGSTVDVDGQPHTVRSLRRADKGWQVAFEGVDDRQAAETIRGRDIFVSEPRGLEAGEFWPEQLIGLEVRPVGGFVVGVEHGPVQSRVVIEKDGSTFEVPFVEALVPVVDIDEGYIEIVVIEGLLPEA